MNLIQRRANGSLAAVTLLLIVIAMLASATPAAAQRDTGGAQPAPAGPAEPAAGTAREQVTPRYVLTYAEGTPQRGDGTASQQDADAAAQQDADAAAARVDARAMVVDRTADNAAVVAIDRPLDEEEQARLEAELAAIPNVLLVEEDRLLTSMQSNDPLLSQQWHYNEPIGGIGVETALTTSTGSGVTVAVIDTGIVAHPDLDAQVVGGYDMISDTFVSRDGNGRDPDFSDPGDYSGAGECGFLSPARNSSWHGSHVAGTVAAVRGNAEGGHGVAPGADILVIRVLGRCGGYTTDIAAGIRWAAGAAVSGLPANPNPADVINMSLGGSGACDSTTQSAINAARSLGTSVVVAAGNSNANAANFSPASCTGVITVAATQRDGGKASYSNFGTTVELAGPGGGTGGGVLSTIDAGATTPAGPTYAQYNGTSMATPHVAGVAAMVLAADPSLTPDQVTSTLVSTARAFPATCSGCGSGIVNAPAALAAVIGAPDPDPDPDPEPEPDPGVFTFTGPLAIPDRGTANAPIAVSRAGNAPADLLVAVDIRHTYRGDLRIDLIAPSGATVRLKNSSSRDSADNVIQTWTVNASSLAASGTWTLRVQDVYRGDIGTINSWSLTF